MQIALESECQEDIEPQSLVEIIKKCTGILCSDGYDQITFSHKTLQEFYTAVFISEQSEEDKKEFYSSVKFAQEEKRYEGVLKFLSSVDRNDYVENYYIACFKEMFNADKVTTCIDNRTMMIGLNKIIDSISIPFNNIERKASGNTLTVSLGMNLSVDDEKSSFFLLKINKTYFELSNSEFNIL
ncbi:hypothetical protein [Pseudoalteromonas phenolica]|uniref:hypothetical protein n=1 Tax=Pseudoalteromonas phenolica TaxID=161398 RepID=UPI000FFE9A7B|nr:hypothetical protein [Pseudoalteromonas phenolica]RXF03559.1 hypothetical protein D9981_05185 [Pseudoalteromonas phenolica O-BC30]